MPKDTQNIMKASLRVLKNPELLRETGKYTPMITPERPIECLRKVYGYDLELMSALPDQNKTKTEPCKLYLSADGRYVIRDIDGKVHEGELKKKIRDLVIPPKNN